VIQGEYVGELDGKTYGVQIWAQGGGKFEAVSHLGGLPGAGWDGDRATITRVGGTRAEGEKSAVFTTTDGSIKAEVNGASILVNNADGVKIMELNRMNRESPTLGAVPPENAVVLFDGKGVNHFPKSRVDEKIGALMEGVTSEDVFGDCSLHVEFFLPYMPEARGQGRGNSGLYLQGRYEVQMLDSFGLEGKDNECGGLYKIAAPKVNMCLPPLTWQTYDVDFTAAQYDAEGKKTGNAKITVKHNGVVIHEKSGTARSDDLSPQ
jgi:3-keto-disaccharide hydrolase